jgi:iron complex transport system substrate-binding protein
MRIASLLSAATEILYGLGLGEQVVAVSHECDYPLEVAAKPRVTRSNVDSARPSDEIDREVREHVAAGGALYEIDAERLAAMAPDLIVTQAQCDVCAVRYADVLALVSERPELRRTRVLALNPQSLEDVFADIRRVGEAAGAASAAEVLVAALKARVAAVERCVAPGIVLGRPKAVVIEWIEPMMFAANWTPELIQLAGGRCDVAHAGRHSTYADPSALAKYDPDVIAIAPCGFDLARTRFEAEVLTTHPYWSELTAVRSGRVFLADGNAYFNRSGPRLIDSVELLAHCIHPTLVERPLWADSRVFERFEHG